MHPCPVPRFDDLVPMMVRYRGGDLSAFTPIYRRLEPWLRVKLRKALGVKGDAQLVDDLLQTTFLKLHDLRQTWVVGAPVAPWVLVIARHLAIDALRRRRLDEAEWTPEGVASNEPSPQALVEARQTAERLAEAFAHLPTGQARAIELIRFDGLDSASAARLLETSAVAVRLRCLRATQTLRAALA